MRLRLGILNKDLAHRFGRASDKFICSDSEFYDLLERADEIMADRGFQIKEKLMLKYCSLSAPPGATVKAQMSTTELQTSAFMSNKLLTVSKHTEFFKVFCR